MTRETYYDDAESREWLLSTHARTLTDEQKTLVRRCCSAFVLYGNEDAPDRIDIFHTNSPGYWADPMIALLPDDYGTLQPVEFLEPWMDHLMEINQ
jgi:hypothetical protein